MGVPHREGWGTLPSPRVWANCAVQTLRGKPQRDPRLGSWHTRTHLFIAFSVVMGNVKVMVRASGLFPPLAATEGSPQCKPPFTRQRGVLMKECRGRSGGCAHCPGAPAPHTPLTLAHSARPRWTSPRTSWRRSRGGSRRPARRWSRPKPEQVTSEHLCAGPWARPGLHAHLPGEKHASWGGVIFEVGNCMPFMSEQT